MYVSAKYLSGIEFDGEHILIHPRDTCNPVEDWYVRSSCHFTDMNEHMEKIVSLVRREVCRKRFVHIVEIGTRYGISTSALFMGLYWQGKVNGSLVSIDIEDCSKHIPENIKGYKELSLVQMNSLSFDYGQRLIDIAFIDGLHEYDQIVQEIDLIHPHLSKKPLLLFHDYQIPDVKHAVNVICDKYGFSYTVNGNLFPLVIMGSFTENFNA